MQENLVLDDFEKSISDFYGDGKSKYTEEQYNLLVNSINVPKINSVFKGKLKEDENGTHFLLDCGFKDFVRIPKNKEEKNFINYFKSEGLEEINVIVTSITDTGEYSINGSVAMIYKEEAFNILKNIKDNEYVDVHIDELTPGGYNTKININGCEIDSFLPQILAGMNKIHDDAKNDLVGKSLNMCIEGYASDKGTWIVSRRKYLKQLIPTYISELNKEILYEGHVTGTTKFGVFVEFNECLTGMIHKSNLNEEFQKRFKDIEPGEPIQFYVKEILNKKKLILSQVFTKSIWDDINIDQKITGEIKEHKPFGTLVKLDHETLGLIHNSEETEKVKNMKEGDKIKVKVLAVDRGKRKIFLRSI
jgi:ribosomal protein S1